MTHTSARRAATATAALYTALTFLVVDPVAAQDDATYSVEAYLAQQQEANALWDAMLLYDEGSADRRAGAEAALEARLGLVHYLTDWAFSGQLPPEMAADVFETRIVLYQNVVAIQEELGLCPDADRTVDELVSLCERHEMTEAMRDAIAYASTSAARCEPLEAAPQTDTTDPGDDPLPSDDPDATATDGDPASHDPALAQAPETPRDGLHPGWWAVGGGTLLVAAGVYVAVDPLQDANNDILDWEANPEERPSDRDIDAREADAKRLDALASGLVITGALGIVGGLSWRLLETDRTEVAVAWRQNGPTLVFTGALP